ncbi:MAG: MarR family EPS-associated transcriptional regulator [Pseudomonas sp.]
MSRVQPDEVRHRLLRMIEERPGLTQREAAVELGISVGKVNYCLRALIDRGYVKLGNFRRSTDKRKYSYWLTPSGIEEKTRVAMQFLRRKRDEYERLQSEIDTLMSEVGESKPMAEHREVR